MVSADGYAFVPSAGTWSIWNNAYLANRNSLRAGAGADLRDGNLSLGMEFQLLFQEHAREQMIQLLLQYQP